MYAPHSVLEIPIMWYFDNNEENYFFFLSECFVGIKKLVKSIPKCFREAMSRVAAANSSKFPTIGRLSGSSHTPKVKLSR